MSSEHIQPPRISIWQVWYLKTYTSLSNPKPLLPWQEFPTVATTTTDIKTLSKSILSNLLVSGRKIWGRFRCYYTSGVGSHPETELGERKTSSSSACGISVTHFHGGFWGKTLGHWWRQWRRRPQFPSANPLLKAVTSEGFEEELNSFLEGWSQISTVQQEPAFLCNT